MLGSSVEKLFERYRRRGDARALAGVFDATAPELFRLAQHLVRDPLEAEDVLQDTFVAAIDAAERWDAGRPLVPWLTGILARKASEARRKARRQVEPDRLHERAEADPADLVADSELSVEILQAIEALPELYRAVLLRHLLDGAKPAEIARDLGRAPGTVRMQIHRGLEQLRKTLPAGFAAGAALAAFSPRGLAAVKQAVLTHAATVAAAGGVAAVTGTSKVATFALGKLAAAGVLAALVAVVATVAWRARAVAPEDLARPGAEELVQASSPRAGLVSPSTDGAAREPGSGVLPPRREPRVRLVGTVAGVGPDELADTRIEVRGVARYRWPAEETLRARPDPSGRFEVVLDPLFALAARQGALSAVSVRALHRAYLADSTLIDLASATPAAAAGDDAPGFELACALTLRPAALVRGEVRDADGPRAGVEVVLVRTLDGLPLRGEIDHVLSDGEGRYVLQAGEVGDYGVLALEPGHVPAFVPLTVRGAFPVDVPPLALDPGRTLRGRVTDLGRPAAGAEVVCVPDDGRLQSGRTLSIAGHLLVAWRERVAWYDLRASADAEGRFELRGLAWEPLRLRCLRAGPELQLLQEEPLLELGPLEEFVELELGSARAVLELVDPDGAALAGEILWWHSGAETGGPVPVPVPAGRVEIAVAARRELRLEACSPAFEPVSLTVGPLEPGAVQRERVVLRPAAAGASFRLSCVSPGSALEYVTLRTGPDPGAGRRVELEQGRAMVEDLPTGAVTLELYANGAWRHFEDLLLPSLRELELDAWTIGPCDVAFERGGRLRLAVKDLAGQLLPARCTVRDLYGAELPVRFLLRSPDEQGFAPGERLSDRGPSDVYPNLASGAYEVELSLEGRETRVLPVRITRGEVSELEVVLP